MGVNLSIETVVDKKVPSGRVVKTDPEKGAIVSSGSTVVVYISSNITDGNLNKKIVPNVVGTTSLEDAKKVLGVNGLNVGSYTSRADGAAAGTVIEQSPAAGEEVLAGSRVTLVISSGLPTCPVCGSTDHTQHPTCEICGSTAHLKQDHVCELCGKKGHGKASCPAK
ncbi:MAG: PASTA domain-containing protein, partial [Oscillospiraceae bacterium]